MQRRRSRHPATAPSRCASPADEGWSERRKERASRSAPPGASWSTLPRASERWTSNWTTASRFGPLPSFALPFARGRRDGWTAMFGAACRQATRAAQATPSKDGANEGTSGRSMLAAAVRAATAAERCDRLRGRPADAARRFQAPSVHGPPRVGHAKLLSLLNCGAGRVACWSLSLPSPFPTSPSTPAHPPALAPKRVYLCVRERTFFVV